MELFHFSSGHILLDILNCWKFSYSLLMFCYLLLFSYFVIFFQSIFSKYLVLALYACTDVLLSVLSWSLENICKNNSNSAISLPIFLTSSSVVSSSPRRYACLMDLLVAVSWQTTLILLYVLLFFLFCP